MVRIESDIHFQSEAAASVAESILQLQNPEKAAQMMRFFKTGKGQYGEGDIFLGLTNPQQHAIAKSWYRKISPEETLQLIQSGLHEFRLTALMIWVRQYQASRKDPARQEAIFKLYCSVFERINNWDLVDISAPKITGPWLLEQENPLQTLREWANSEHLWTQRIAVLSCFAFLRSGRFDETLEVCRILLNHPHDLIHKACGWMLREIGKRDIETEQNFLEQHYSAMARTQLRYAIERFPEAERKSWLKK